MPERLQKILAEGGIGSRRECETLIEEGRVEVDRTIVTKLGTKVDPEKQVIRVDGELLKLAAKKYFVVNKPRGVISTNNDPSGRLRVIDLIGTDQHVYTVGRLDKDSEGLIIVTNDGALADKLTHPKYGIEKTYLIQVEGHPTREQMESLVSGVYLAEGLVQIKSFQFKRKQKHTTEIEIVLNEGKNREVRRLLAKIGHKVLFLRRTAVGSFVLEGLPFGSHRQMTPDEVELLTQNPKRKKRKAVTKKKKQHVAQLEQSPKSKGRKTDPSKRRSSSESDSKYANKRGVKKPSKSKAGARTNPNRKSAKKVAGKSAVKKSKSSSKTGRKSSVNKSNSGSEKTSNKRRPKNDSKKNVSKKTQSKKTQSKRGASRKGISQQGAARKNVRKKGGKR